MAFNPYNPKDLANLRDSISGNSKRWQAHLDNRLKLMRQVTGFNYGPASERTADYVIYPLLGMMYRIFSRLIVSNDPRAHVVHWDPDYDPHCHELKLSLDDEFERIELGNTLRDVANESLFLAGWTKIGRIDKSAVEDAVGYQNPVGSVFVDPVLSEDIIFDMRSKRWKTIGYIGDWTKVPTEWIHENKEFPKNVRERIGPTNDIAVMPFAGNMRRVRSQVLSTGQMQPLEQDYEDQSDIGTIYFARERKVLTIDRSITHVLKWEDWDGPPGGPYRNRLGYTYIPGNLIPLSPLAEVVDQHLAANFLANKTIEMAKNQKTVLVATGPTGRKDADAVQAAKDRDVIFSNNPNGINQITYNGPDQGLWTLASLLRDSFKSDAGNLDAVGGMAPQSGTVGQDRLLLESASQQVKDMQGDVAAMTTGVMNDVAWYMRHDPTWKRKLVKTIEMSNIRVPFDARPALLPGNFEDYRIRLEPYSLQPRTPQQRADMLKGTIKELVLPLMPMLEQRGISLNVERLFKRISELQDQPEFSDMIEYTQGETERPAGARGRKPPETERTYIRKNVSQSTAAGRGKVLLANAMGQRVQPKEQALLTR